MDRFCQSVRSRPISGERRSEGELLEDAREAGVLEGASFDLADRVHHGGVVAPVELRRDRREERSVRSRVRYMAIWRARDTAVRFGGERIAPTVRPSFAATASWIWRASGRAEGASISSVGSARSTASALRSEAVSEERATTRVSAPFSTRRLADVFAAIARRASGKLLGLLACEVAQEEKSGGEVGARPDRQSPLEAVAESLASEESSAGTRSAVRTSCAPCSYSALKVWKNSSAVRGLFPEKLDVVDQEHVGAAIAPRTRRCRFPGARRRTRWWKHSAVV